MSLMLKEIHEQPAVLERILDQPAPALEDLAKRFSASRPAMIVLVARGTSDNAALFGRYLFEITLGIPTMLAAPSVATLYRRLVLPRDTLVIGISQSGESTDINSYVESAKRNGALTIGITNEPSSTLGALADEVLPTEAGKESSVAATKTYTAQMFMLCCLARALGARIAESDLRLAPAAVRAQLNREDSVQALAAEFLDMSHSVVLGRGFNYANSFEFALKLMETSYVVSTAFSGADFAHGPIAMVEEGFPVFVFVPPGPTAGETDKLITRLRQARAETIGIGPSSMLDGLRLSHRIELSGSTLHSTGLPDDILTPIPAIVPAQMFAAHLAAAKGLDPDKPRMLSKVTQTL